MFKILVFIVVSLIALGILFIAACLNAKDYNETIEREKEEK